MFENKKALQAGVNGIILGLLWYGLFLAVYWFAGTLLHLYQFIDFMENLSLWLSFALAGVSLAWSFSRGKPHVAYGGLHVFFALCCFGMALLLAQEFVLFLPLVISLLLFIFIQPILALLPGHSEAATVKWAREDLPPYQVGYRPPRSEAVYEEGGQHFPFPDRGHAQAQTLYPQTDQ